MSTLFVAWQSPDATRAWFPIGRLDASEDESEYVFRYTRGALHARDRAGFKPLVAFPKFDARYESRDLFPLFKNRVLDPKRKDFKEYLDWLALDPASAGPIEILGLTGGERQTDSLEVFPKISRSENGDFKCRFFLHGLRHVSQAGQQRAKSLQVGEALRVALEVNNPATRLAVQIQTTDGHLVGWSPRYLVHDLCMVIGRHTHVEAQVARINAGDVPAARRIMVELSGSLPFGIDPMTDDEYQVLSA